MPLEHLQDSVALHGASDQKSARTDELTIMKCAIR